MQIKSDFLILDVKRGKVGLRNKLWKDGEDLVPIIIFGTITDVHGRDDGVSQEFCVDVDRVEVL